MDFNNWEPEVIVGVCYMSMQTIAAVVLSVVSYLYVIKNRKCDGESSLTTTIVVHSVEHSDEENDKVDVDLQMNEFKQEEKVENDGNVQEESRKSKKSQKSFCKEWMRTIWKMRSVYSSFIVHSFDITTDIMVIIQWWFEESGSNENIENINTRLMAQMSIGVLIFHKIMSTFSIYYIEKNYFRALLQFFDLLILQEIYNAHEKIKSNQQG